MVGITSLSDLGHWARGSGLEIVLIVTGALLLARVAGWAGNRITGRIDAHSRVHDELVVPEATKHRHALVQVGRWVVVVLLYLVAAVLVLQRLGVPLTALIAPATVVGVAVGFGAQRIVQDLLAGFFLVAERQYGYGDVVRISPLGSATGVSGSVEDVTLRITRLRTVPPVARHVDDDRPRLGAVHDRARTGDGLDDAAPALKRTTAGVRRVRSG